jgi:formylmethanofuran dehydrogenase subunit E
MFVELKEIITEYFRTSKLGQMHQHQRTKFIVVLRCDNCGEVFERPRAKMEPKRISNSYFHCCSNCDAKRFAQRKGIDRRAIWDRPASSSDDISRL